MDHLPAGLSAQLELADRTLLALETYMAQAREIIGNLRKLLDEARTTAPTAGKPAGKARPRSRPAR